MIEVNVIERERECDRDMLQDLKAYASVPDNSRDGLLKSLLMKALLSVQRVKNKSLVDCTLELREDDITDRRVLLYQDIDKVVSVEDEDGAAVPYRLSGQVLHLGHTPEFVRVVWTTKKKQGNFDDLLPLVFRYATALYDGEPTDVLNGILREC